MQKAATPPDRERSREALGRSRSVIRSVVLSIGVALVGVVIGTIVWSGVAGVLGALGLLSVGVAIDLGPIAGLLGATAGLWGLK